MSSVPQVTNPDTHPAPVDPTAPPLSSDEKAKLTTQLMSSFSLTEEQATALTDKLTPTEARTYMDLSSGKTSITREQAQEMWGLSNEEADAMFGHKDKVGVFDNPFGDLFLQFLMLSYSLGIDIKKLMSSVSGMRFEQAISAAKDRKEGAIAEFACAMAAMAATFAFSGASFYRIKQIDNKTNPHDPMLQWYTPMTANLFTGPINAAGSFGKSMEEFEAQVKDGNNQLLDSVFQQLMNTWQSSSDAGRTYTSGL